MGNSLFFRALQFLLKGVIAFLMVMLLYFVAAVIGSAIPVNNDPTEGDINIYLRTNGLDTVFIFPLHNEQVNWNSFLELEDISSRSQNFKYIAIGWGDLAFYLSAKKERDNQFPGSFQAVFLPKESALHVTYLEAIRLNQPTIKLEITKDQYRKLSAYVMESFKTRDHVKPQPVKDFHYNQHDVFYPAMRSLNFFYTSNTWVNNGLKKAGLKACLWTPFDKGIFYQYR